VGVSVLLLGGCIVLAWTGAARAQNGEITDLGILKKINVVQSADGTVVNSPSNPFEFLAFTDTATDVLLGSTLFPPDALIFQNLTPDNSGLHYALEAGFSDQLSMNAKYPAGNYGLLEHDFSHNIQTVTLNLGVNNFPGPPLVSNYDAAQHIDAETDFNLLWTGFPDATSQDFVQLQISDTSGIQWFISPDFACAGAIPATQTNILVPAGTLLANQNYQGSLTIIRFTTYDTTLYAGALSVAGFSSALTFSVATFPAPIIPPPSVLSQPSLASTKGFQFSFSSVSNAVYTVEVSADLKNWQAGTPVTAKANATQYTDTNAPALPQRFYRVRAGN
jgi:hypothetical protein